MLLGSQMVFPLAGPQDPSVEKTFWRLETSTTRRWYEDLAQRLSLCVICAQLADIREVPA